jgi:ribonuclease D
LNAILIAIRKRIGEREGLNPTTVFKSDQLSSLCKKKPKTLKELKEIDGFVASKIRKYGGDILNEIRSYLEMEPLTEAEMKEISDFEKSKSFPITFTQGVKSLIKDDPPPSSSQQGSSQKSKKNILVIEDEDDTDDDLELLEMMENEIIENKKLQEKETPKVKMSTFTIKTPKKKFYDD